VPGVVRSSSYLSRWKSSASGFSALDCLSSSKRLRPAAVKLSLANVFVEIAWQIQRSYAHREYPQDRHLVNLCALERLVWWDYWGGAFVFVRCLVMTGFPVVISLLREQQRHTAWSVWSGSGTVQRHIERHDLAKTLRPAFQLHTGFWSIIPTQPPLARAISIHVPRRLSSISHSHSISWILHFVSYVAIYLHLNSTDSIWIWARISRLMVWTTNVLSVNDFSTVNLHFTPIAGRHHDTNGVKGVSGSSLQLKRRPRMFESPADIMSVRPVLKLKTLLPAKSFKTT
jgi:hypothetical protein